MHSLDGTTLLARARESIAQALELPAAGWTDGPWLDAPGATFVTLTQAGELRGCIGSLVAFRSLRDDVRANALASAFRDPRFPGLTRAELRKTRIEVSVLTPPEPFPVSGEADAMTRLRPGMDGVVLSLGGRSATFLPQVWDELPDARAFLEHLKRKAGIPAHGWPEGLRLERYQALKFKEDPP